MNDIRCFTPTIWMKDTPLLENKFPVIYGFIADIEEMTDV